VNVILIGPQFKDWHVQFTMLSFKPFSDHQ